jgi:hypothetical protein
MLLPGLVAVGQTRKRHRRVRRQSVGIGYTRAEWPPAKDSLFYKFTVALPTVDRLEIYKLDKLYIATEEDGIAIPQAGRAHVAASMTLTGPDAERLAKTWRALQQGAGSGCFAPGFYLKFFSSGQLLLETSVCFGCSNLTLMNEAGTTETWGFAKAGSSGQALLSALNEIIPRPPKPIQKVNNPLD